MNQVYFYTVVENRKYPDKKIMLAATLDGDRVIYCKGRLRKKFIHQFETSQDQSKYLLDLLKRSGKDNMMARRYEGE